MQPKYKLVSTAGELKGQSFIITEESITIGRLFSNDIVLKLDPRLIYVSRKHCEIFWRQKKGCFLRNFSHNGTEIVKKENDGTYPLQYLLDEKRELRLLKENEMFKIEGSVFQLVRFEISEIEEPQEKRQDGIEEPVAIEEHDDTSTSVVEKTKDDDKEVLAIRGMLNDIDYKVRSQGVEAVRKLSSQKATEILIEVMRTDMHTGVRWRAARVIGQMKLRGGIQALIAALRDSEREVRRNAAYSLGLLGAKEAVTSLIKALDDSDGWVRGDAAEALRMIGAEQAIEPLIRTLINRDEDSVICENIIGALSEINQKQGMSILIGILEREPPSIRTHITSALHKVELEQAEVLLNQIIENAKKPDVKRWAEHILDRLRSGR